MKLYTLIFRSTIDVAESVDGWVLWGWGHSSHRTYRKLLFDSRELLEQHCKTYGLNLAGGIYAILELGDVIYEDE